jgi:hypothetical protein
LRVGKKAGWGNVMAPFFLKPHFESLLGKKREKNEKTKGVYFVKNQSLFVQSLNEFFWY